MVDTRVSTQGNDRTLSHTVTQPFKTFVYEGILVYEGIQVCCVFQEQFVSQSRQHLCNNWKDF